MSTKTIKIKILNKKPEVPIKSIKPILKWAGGKTQILDKIFTHFPKNINDYYEPFCGGGSVFINLLNDLEKGKIVVSGNININDINKNLINLYKFVKNNINELIEELDKIKDLYFLAKEVVYPKRHKYKIDMDLSNDELIVKGRSYIFYYYRDIFNKKNITEIEKCAIFLFLNKTCFRGLYREGVNGFNVPYGNYKNPLIYDKTNMVLLHKLLNKYDVIFTEKQYNIFLLDERILKNGENFIYLDPPYYPLNKKSFTTYNKNGFSVKDNEILLSICNIFFKNNIKFIHSNSYCDYNLEMYKNYKYEKISCKRSINSKNPESKVYEMLILSL